MHDDYKPLIIRHAEPHKYDQAPFGTYCKVIMSDKIYKIYQQNSHDEENPKWELIEIYNSK